MPGSDIVRDGNVSAARDVLGSLGRRMDKAKDWLCGIGRKREMCLRTAEKIASPDYAPVGGENTA